MGLIDPPPLTDAEVIRLSGTQALASRGRDQRRIGPISTDFTSVVQNNTGDGTLTTHYALGVNAAVPATHPMNMGLCTPKALTSNFGYWESEYPLFGSHVFSVMTDAPKIVFKAGYLNIAYAWQAWIDGAPVTLDPVVGNGGVFLNFNFPNGGVARLIEIMTRGGLGDIWVAPPYRAWNPGNLPSPRGLVMGDSYVMTTSFDAAGAALPGEFGIYHRMRGDLGIMNFSVDGIGGSGYGYRNPGGIGGPNNSYLDRLPSALALQPDLLIIHGGGANDMANGRTEAQVIADATTLFQDARDALPNAKLVFVEGFAPPGFSPGVYNPKYIAVRQGVQAALMDVGVYYIDVATTSPWLSGTGYFGATNGTGNSDIYVGPDSVHLMAAGSNYIRARMAQRLRRVLNDNGALVNTLI